MAKKSGYGSQDIGPSIPAQDAKKSRYGSQDIGPGIPDMYNVILNIAHTPACTVASITAQCTQRQGSGASLRAGRQLPKPPRWQRAAEEPPLARPPKSEG